jgi:hypothetical protein
LARAKPQRDERQVGNDDEGHPVPCHEHTARNIDTDLRSRTSSGPADIVSAQPGRTYDRKPPSRSKRREKTLANPGRPHMARRELHLGTSVGGHQRSRRVTDKFRLNRHPPDRRLSWRDCRPQGIPNILTTDRVRSRGQSRKHMLAVMLTRFDPKRSSPPFRRYMQISRILRCVETGGAATPPQAKRARMTAFKERREAYGRE